MVEEFDLPMEIIDRRVTKMKMISPSNREVRSALRCVALHAGLVAPRAHEVMLPAVLVCSTPANASPLQTDVGQLFLDMRATPAAATFPTVLVPCLLQVDVGKTLNEKEWIGMCRREVRCAGCSSTEWRGSVATPAAIAAENSPAGCPAPLS